MEVEKQSPKEALQIYIGLLPYLEGLTHPEKRTAQIPNACRGKLQSIRLELSSVCFLYNLIHYYFSVSVSTSVIQIKKKPNKTALTLT